MSASESTQIPAQQPAPAKVLGNPKVPLSFLYIEDSNPVLVFADPTEAKNFCKSYHGAQIYGDPNHVFVPKPHGLEAVRAAKHGELAYLFHYAKQAQHWLRKLGDVGFMLEDGTPEHSRTVFIGVQRA
jgi:hypothetical protein